MRIFKWLLFFVILIIIGFFIFRHFTKTPKDLQNPTITVQKGKILAIVRGRGEVVPAKTYKIISPLPGVVESVLKDEGEPVKEGELVLSIDKTECLAKLKQAEKEIQEYQNKIAELEDEIEIKRYEKEIREASLILDDAKREYEANGRLYERGGVSKEALQDAESSLEKARIALTLKEEELFSLKRKRKDGLALLLLQAKEASANYDWIKKQLSYTEIKSPISGIIIEKNPDIMQGFFVTQGAYLFTVTRNSYQIKGLIDEIEIEKINIGGKGVIRLDTHPYQPFSGVIKKISPKLITSEGKIGIRSFEVYLDINPPFKVTPKMQCSLEFKQVVSGVLKVNLEDVEEEDGSRYVYLMKGKKKIKTRIKTGFENESEAEVLSGLKEGDKIVKSPSFEIEKQ